MDAALEHHLRLGAAALGVTADDRLVQGLSRYLDLLLFWNKAVNLTAVRDPESIVDKHFLDSLAVLPHIPSAARTLADIGTGGGFPGAVLALARPDLSVALVESIHKKAAFLEALRRGLPLTNATVHAERAEDWAKSHTPKPEVVVSRATWDLVTWLDRAQTLVTSGGLIIGMEGGTLHDLPANATRHPYPHPQGSRAIILMHSP